MWFKILNFGVLFLTVSGFVPHIKDINVSFANEIELWAKFDHETELFKDMIKTLQIPTELQNLDWRSFAAETNIAICQICQGTVKSFIKLRREGASEENIRNKLIKLLDSKPNLTATTICGVVLESKSCPLDDPEFDWNINIDNNSDTVITENETQEQIKILQLTDIHYDPAYEVNGNSNCGEPVCCRKGQNKTNVNSLAGFWGDYESCDTPWHAITDALTHIKETHQDIDFIYFTGDIIDHGVWETSKEGNIQSLVKIYDKMHDIFKNIVLYPIFGNHEPHPLNQFAPRNITQKDLTTRWLYELMADLWIGYGWLPESARSTILQGGYYTVTPRKGFRIIALNSNACYSYNWWLLYNPKDPDNQLQWLASTLLEAEKNSELVHILSHIPANSNSCLKTWKREYLRIINRFSHLIKAEFNGHTHNDEIAIFYNSDAITKNVAWNGGSITAYSRLNPNYKIYTVNNSNYAVNDYENWMYDLSTANKNIHIKPTWYKSYSFKAEYGLSDLSATSLSNWLSLAVKNDTLLDTYYR
ncbi:Sphingomyelin phosphodiesterase [Habropoda laboriosa]|uniref:Sphingomyelin phosphodiesterase n=1 Tax=Habropoda laboriosa TaxID=597456 RepID=A0A0L7R790_9HYME|nr:Sphingomyelin phosphodiesterase [Habropoda laboriosa]